MNYEYEFILIVVMTSLVSSLAITVISLQEAIASADEFEAPASVETDQEILNYIPIGISIAAFILALITLKIRYSSHKTDEFRIFLDIVRRLEEINYERSLDPDNIYEDSYNQAEEYLKTLEFLSFLINNGQITNKNIIKYLKPNLIENAKAIVERFPDIEKKRRYDELRILQEKLLRENW